MRIHILALDGVFDLGLAAITDTLSTANQLAGSLATRSPAAIAGLKQILSIGDSTPMDRALVKEQEIFQSVVTTDEALHGMKRVQAENDR